MIFLNQNSVAISLYPYPLRVHHVPNFLDFNILLTNHYATTYLRYTLNHFKIQYLF
jgi:hypothetical protein